MIHFEYDKERKKEKAEVLMPWGIEIHARVPINPEDVSEAAENSGLVIEDYFSSALLPGRWYTGPVCFFVLRRASS